MNNLYTRLKPEYKAKLEQESKDHPNAVKSAVKELVLENSILDLRFGTVQVLAMYLNLKSADISTILNLFEEI
jgi:hypothetical protein